MTTAPIEKRVLSKENILQLNFFNEIDSWPLIRKANDNYNGDVWKKYRKSIRKEHIAELSRIDKTIEDFVNRQRTIISWLLAVIFGVFGGLLINLLFDQPLSLNEVPLWLLILAITGMTASIVGIFVYYPQNCSFRITYFPTLTSKIADSRIELEKLNKSCIELQTEKLNAKAVSLKDSNSFIIRILDYAGVASSTILRDKIKETPKLHLIRIKELKQLSPSKMIYILTFDLKHGLFFWFPKIGEKIQNELKTINDSVMAAKMFVNSYAIDNEPSHWREKGHLFLNEIVELDLTEITRQIEKQILDSLKNN